MRLDAHHSRVLTKAPFLYTVETHRLVAVDSLVTSFPWNHATEQKPFPRNNLGRWTSIDLSW